MVADNNMQPFLIFYSQFLLVPIHCTTRIASLVPFQSIGQHTGISTNTEVIGSKGTK